MLKGALKELSIGRTDRLSIDIGPVITDEARRAIEAHVEKMRSLGRKVEQTGMPAETAAGTFVAPTIIELQSLKDLEREVFGPVRSEEHTSELQSLMRISYAVFCLKKKNTKTTARQQ